MENNINKEENINNNEQSKKINKKIIIEILVLLIILIGIIICILVNNSNTNKENGKSAIEDSNTNSNENNNGEGNENNDDDNEDICIANPNDAFALNECDAMGGYGKVQVRGYVRIVSRQEDWQCEEKCKMIDYITFIVVETENKDFQTWITEDEGNFFVGSSSIGLGSYSNSVISWYNAADINDGREVERSLSKEDSKKIMNSTKDKLVTLDLERLLLSDGGEAEHANYSHFSYIIVK